MFYRLNVFPVTMPPLRDRPEDIPDPVRVFTQQYARRMNKIIHRIPATSLDALVRYDWPGNIRELQNLVERSVILSQGAALQVPLAELQMDARPPAPARASLEETKRAHILKVVSDSRWVIGGPDGAASRLGLKRTTLASRMKRLGIARPVRSNPAF